jgi:hypothetical protein
MVDAGNMLGVLAAVLLLMAVVSWVQLIRGPPLQRTDGRTGIDADEDNEFASELLLWAAGLSTAAMFLAVGGWIFK